MTTQLMFQKPLMFIINEKGVNNEDINHGFGICIYSRPYFLAGGLNLWFIGSGLGTIEA